MARSYNNHSLLDYISCFSMSIHLFFFISILFSILCLSWYINYEDKFEDLINQVKLFLMLSPVVLLLLVHCLSSCFPVFLPFPERDSLHRAGGSPWGVALLLVFLIFMISYQSSFHELRDICSKSQVWFEDYRHEVVHGEMCGHSPPLRKREGKWHEASLL
ncbi:hypothetical protein NC652_000226 [Populus alba x Populus x berolinensis]|nr:hypothetical protein NC652_000226 [Populus alba x Populus x berolinensis]